MLQYSLLVAVPSAANELLLNIQTNTGSVADSSLQHAFRNPPSSPTPPRPAVGVNSCMLNVQLQRV